MSNPVPDAVELARVLAEVEGQRRAVILILEVVGRQRADVVRLSALADEMSDRVRMLEAMLRGQS